jgi:hypothetical protein
MVDVRAIIEDDAWSDLESRWPVLGAASPADHVEA